MAKSIKKLKALSFQQAVAYAKTRKGEDFQERYFEDKESFIAMMVSQIRMEKDLNKYFNDYYNAIVNEVNWNKYKAGAKVSDLLDEIPFMTSADMRLEQIVLDNMISAWTYGLNQTKKDLKQDHDGLNKFTTDKYYQLAKAHAKQINKTTRKFVMDILKNERSLEENKVKEENSIDSMFSRLSDRLKSDARAESITDTETISFFAGAGAVVINFFSKFQKIKKRWLAVSDKRTCERCRNAASKGWVGKDFLYNVQFGLVKTNPAHGRCRCYVEYRTK